MESGFEVDPDTEIDPDLFLKCRLCIVETGAYQIHQTLQDQIRFCFDINVKHADCLSQLVCRKCRNVVNSFYETKRNFMRNQTILFEKLNNSRKANESQSKANHDEDTEKESDKNSLLHNQTVADDLPTKLDSSESDEESILNTKRKIKRKKLTLPADSSSSSDDEEKKIPKKYSPQFKKSNTWHRSYKKNHICRFCNSEFTSLQRINRHMVNHLNLIKIHNRLVGKHCSVRMEKIEDKTNLTGEITNVVIDSSNIIHNEANVNFFVRYTPVIYVPDEAHEEKKSKNKRNKCLSSDNEIKMSKKKIRLHSRTSSNETVVINYNTDESKNDVNSNNQLVTEDCSDIQCINLDDSSNDSNSNPTLGNSVENDLKIINEIISGCYKKHLCNLNNEPHFYKGKKGLNSNVLNSKLLSTGRKTLSTSGVGSLPGLLKYLQYKNLNIQWLNCLSSLDSNRVRIMAKMDTNVTSSLDGWLKLFENTGLNQSLVEMPSKKVEICHESTNKIFVSIEDTIKRQEHPATTTASGVPSRKQVKGDATLQQLLESDNILKSKLLNASPVANPKQLPKKNILYDIKTNIVAVHTAEINQSDAIILEYDNEQVGQDETMLSLPIITSTTSLAHENTSELPSIELDNQLPSNTPVEKPIPRLKCKPVSELMARQFLPGENKGNNLATTNHTDAINFENVPPLKQAQPTPPMPIMTLIPNSNINSVSITMNSVELPNTSSLRPIEYFKNLLEMHRLHLVTQADFDLSKDFINLVKFRLEVTQLNNSLILCIALFGSDSIFCLRLGTTKEEMDIDTLPPHWQMRVLNSFRGKVSQKILASAQKTNAQFYGNVRQFVVLLEGIEFKSS